MIIVTGSVNARPEHAEEVERLSLEHVALSRAQPGCILHSVHRDVEDTHFAVPVSGGFVNTVAGLATAEPSMEIYEAERLTL